MTLILGIESTCDETAAAIVKDGKQILSNVVASQEQIHQPYGGVFPELASRGHLEKMVPVVQQAVLNAKVALTDLDAIAVAQGPGLIGALLVGINTAKGLALGLGKPLIPVNHVEAHLYAAMMDVDAVPLPALGIVISGGHTSLLLIHDVGHYQLISTTVDDAIGEAFDKVAAMLGLPYPGGPAIENIAKKGDPTRYTFHAGRVKNHPLAFSFSGLKTNVLYAVKGENAKRGSPRLISDDEIPHIAASFQECALQDIVNKAQKALDQYPCRSILVGGGVSNNRRLRALMATGFPNHPIFWPPPGLSLDNAAMIAGLGTHKQPIQGLDLQPQPRLQPFWQ